MVPTEIVDHVLGCLHSDEDHKALETCSLIFPELVERHLYSQITFILIGRHPPTNGFDVGNYVVDPVQFSLTLIDRPHVANYVRSVRIFVQQNFARDLAVISSILSKLSQIKSIALSATRRHLSWNTLDPFFLTVFQNSIQLPSIEGVTISDFDLVPLNIFDGCKNLRDVLLFTHCADGEAAAIPHLRSFGVDHQSDLILTKIAALIKINTLHSLSLRMDDHLDLHQMQILIEACAPTLVNLELNHRWCLPRAEYSTHPIMPLLQVQLPRLERIIIRSPVATLADINFGDYLSSLPLLAPFLSSIPIICPLSVIQLCLHLEFFIQRGTSLLDVNWSDVAAFLALPIFHYPIEMYIYVSSGAGSLADVVSSFEQDSDLKRLHETGKLVIKQARMYLYR